MSSSDCPLCDRAVPLTRHHLKLERRDKTAVVKVCRECQQVIHGSYPGTALARRPDLWTLEGLKVDPLIQQGLTFVRKVRPGDTMRMKDRRRR